jgi:hypothetical protein
LRPEIPPWNTIKKKRWIIRDDAATGKKWSHFVDSTSEMVPLTLSGLGLLDANGMHFDSLCMDPSGKNKKL